MKNLITLLFLLCFVIHAQSQTIEGSCDEVSVISVPSYDSDLIIAGGWKSCPGCNPCERLYVTSPPIYMQTRHQLQKKTPSGWTNIGGYEYGDYSTFTNLSKGTYRVLTQLPQRNTNVSCPEGHPVLSFYTLGHLGWHGSWIVNQTSSYSNEVIVGPTDSSDNNFDFIDIYGTGSSSAFNDGETVYVDFSETKNYSQYYLSINEEGGTYNRWKDSNSGAWVHDLIDDTYDLSNMWSSGTGWDFEPLHTYHVNFVNDNSKCRNTIEYPAPTWNIRTKSFFVCPAGSGCREVVEERNFTIYPNPASNYIELGDFDPSVDSGYSLTLTSINGQTIKNVELSSDRIDISDLNSGMYIILLERNGQRVFQSKLMVSP